MDNQNEYIDPQQNEDKEFNFSETIGNYVKHWPWIVVCLAISMTISYFYAKYQVPVYKIQASILIKDNSVSSDKDLLAQLNLNPSTVVIDNEIQILKSEAISQRAVEALNLQYSYFVKGNFINRILYKNMPLEVKLITPSPKAYSSDWSIKYVDANTALFNGKKVKLGQAVQTQAGLILISSKPDISMRDIYYVSFGKPELIAAGYAGRITIAPVSKSSTVLNITTENEVPERGKDFLNQLVSEYNQAGLEYKNRNIANSLTFIDGRLKDLVLELGQTEKQVVNYRSRNNITDLSAQSQVYLGTVASNDAQLAKIDLQLSTLENVVAYVGASDNENVRLPSLMGMEDPTISILTQRLGDAQLKKQSLLRTIPATNPIIGSIDDQINSIKSTLNQTLKNVRSGLIANKQQLTTLSKRYEANIKDVPNKERGLLDVMREQNIKNNLFNFLLQKREEASLSLASAISDSRTISSAKATNFPIKPIKSSIYLAFFIVGIVLPVTVIFASEALNTKIRKKSDIEKLSDIPILAQISKSDEEDSLVTVFKPRSMVAEQIRGLRTNLQFILLEDKAKVILFTSTISGEGKSYLSLNLGASIASTNKKVVILELDLRRPKLLSTLKLERKTGLSEYLIGKAGYDQIIREIPHQPGFHLIESGAIPPNPAELLVNGKLKELVEKLKQDYDYILLDTPPVGLVTDAQILSRLADATLFVVRYNYTSKSSVRLINELKRKRVFSKLNIIFNSVDKSGLGYGYGYGYNYGYYDEPVKEKLSFFRKRK